MKLTVLKQPTYSLLWSIIIFSDCAYLLNDEDYLFLNILILAYTVIDQIDHFFNQIVVASYLFRIESEYIVYIPKMEH